MIFWKYGNRPSLTALAAEPSVLRAILFSCIDHPFGSSATNRRSINVGRYGISPSSRFSQNVSKA
jgi:hypothetical protein